MSFFELSAIYISFLIVVLIIGFIKFDKKIKKKIMLVLSTIYNIAMGVCRYSIFIGYLCIFEQST